MSFRLKMALPQVVRGGSRVIFLSAGLAFTGIGIIGIVTPILPTTPFLLLASLCFAQSSPRFHSWLLHHPRLGPPINDWKKSGVIRLPAKRLATLLIVFNASFPLFIIESVSDLARLITIACMAGVFWFIWSRPSEPSQGKLG